MARETPWVVSHTRMYWDYPNNAWMTTIATPDVAASGKHRILACVDALLDELMERTTRPAMQGAYSTLFIAERGGHADLQVAAPLFRLL